MSSFPITKATLLDRSTGIVFIAIAIDNNFAIAGDGNQFELDSCEPVKIETFDRPRILIGDEGTEISIERCPEGLRFNGRLRIELDDDVSAAAKTLAETFNGSIVVDVPEQFRIQEVDDDDDW